MEGEKRKKTETIKERSIYPTKKNCNREIGERA